MGSSKTSTGHRSKRTTSHHAKEAITFESFLHSLRHTNESTTKQRGRSWTKQQLSDANFLKVPASVWKNIHDPTRTEWMEGTENTLTPALAAGALLDRPNVGLCKVHKWFWDNSIETKDRKDKYRFRVIDQATDVTILPENEEYDPLDDETKIKILYVGLPFKDHHILLLRRICPDVNMNAFQTADEWANYLSPSIREGYYKIKGSTTYGWAPVVKRKKTRRS